MSEMFRDGPMVEEFGEQLARFVGERVRIYTLDGKKLVGKLASAPMIYNAIADGALTHRGVAVIEQDDGERQFCPVETISTYDVVPQLKR